MTIGSFLGFISSGFHGPIVLVAAGAEASRGMFSFSGSTTLAAVVFAGPRGNNVLLPMGVCGHELEILGTIISRNTVAMMGKFVLGELSP